MRSKETGQIKCYDLGEYYFHELFTDMKHLNISTRKCVKPLEYFNIQKNTLFLFIFNNLRKNNFKRIC